MDKINNCQVAMDEVDCLCSVCKEVFSFVSVKLTYSFHGERRTEWIDLCSDCFSVIIKERDEINNRNEIENGFLFEMEVGVI